MTSGTAVAWELVEDQVKRFRQALEQEAPSEKWFQVRRDAEHLALRPSFERLITLDHNTIKELPHQIKVAERLLSRQMLARGMLADEVGLGKTIEAGIILKELVVRGLARRILILTPAALVDQWAAELETKFFERFDTPQEPADWHHTAKAICSISRARHDRHAPAILRHRWDLVIVDEAHKIKNHRSKAYRLVSQIDRNYILLLTATPLQNDLRELYNLVNLLRPGWLGTWRDFQKQHLTRGDRRRPRDPEAIRDLTASVMVRTRRANVSDSVRLPPRHPMHPRVELSPQESSLYQETVRFLRDLYRRGFYQRSAQESAEDQRRRKYRTGRGVHALERIRLCRRLCSSTKALASSLKTVAQGELVLPEFRARAHQLARAAASVETHAKLGVLAKALDESADRLIVFSEHRPTLNLIAQLVRQKKRPAVLFHGGMSRRHRARNLAHFRDAVDSVFIATKAGTEGLNLQHCNRMVNYDLPWNPMVVEQRIGRIHRIGQMRETFITNLAAVGTVEQRVLELLHQKIRLFELVVGELDVILGEFGGAQKLEHRLVDAWLDAESDREFESELDKIGEEIERSRDAGKGQEDFNSTIAVEDDAGRLEREFAGLPIPARVKLGYGTRHLIVARGVEAKRHRRGLHVNEIHEMLGMGPVVGEAESHSEYGPLLRITGVTGRGRALSLLVQADRLPMVWVDLDCDEEAPLVPVP